METTGDALPHAGFVELKAQTLLHLPRFPLVERISASNGTFLVRHGGATERRRSSTKAQDREGGPRLPTRAGPSNSTMRSRSFDSVKNCQQRIVVRRKEHGVD